MNFEEAQNFVKIGHFTRKGGVIRGVIHVGANDGEEIEGYLGLGSLDVVCFEPLQSARQRLLTRWRGHPCVEVYPCALGAANETLILHVTEGDGKGSSFLPEFGEPYKIVESVICEVRRLDSFNLDMSLYNTLVIDVQGMEMEVLQGFGETLYCFDFLNVECSQALVYEGGVTAQEVVNYLDANGFQQDSPIVSHDDIMFVNRRLGWPQMQF